MPMNLGFGFIVRGIGGAIAAIRLIFQSESGSAATYEVPSSLIISETSDKITIDIPDFQILSETNTTISIEA